MTTTQQEDSKRVFVEIVQGALHASNAAGLLKVLDANRGGGNGVEDHILTCEICKRVLKAEC
jgi:hypothetical protein